MLNATLSKSIKSNIAQRNACSMMMLQTASFNQIAGPTLSQQV
jgi:hypothetical protein